MNERINPSEKPFLSRFSLVISPSSCFGVSSSRCGNRGERESKNKNKNRNQQHGRTAKMNGELQWCGQRSTRGYANPIKSNRFASI